MAEVPRKVILLGVVLLVGCASAPTDPAPDRADPAPLAVERRSDSGPLRISASPRSGSGDLAVARVGGTEIRRSDVGDFAIRYYRDQANEILTHLIDERIIDAEAERLGVRLPPGLLEREVGAEFRERERTVKVQFGADVTMAEYLRDRFGVTVEEHRADLSRLLRTRLLRDRLIRYFELVNDRLLVRDAVFAAEADARAAAEAARAGAELARIAREKGVRPGIDLPPFVRDEISPPELSDLLFSLPEGEITDPVAVTEEGKTTWHVFRIVRRMPGRDVAWSEGAGRLEAGLADRPVESFEYLQWARQVRDRYAVEVLR